MEGGCEGPGEDWQNIAVTIREEIARRRMSRQMLADQARISLSTLEKALAGKRSFTLATLVRIESALDMNLRPSVHAPAIPSIGRPEEAGFSAPIELGGYVRKAVTWLEGSPAVPAAPRSARCRRNRTPLWQDERDRPRPHSSQHPVRARRWPGSPPPRSIPAHV